MTPTFRAAALATVAAAMTGSAHQSPERPWPPPVAKIAPVSRALSPAEALGTFGLPPGFRIELVAAEPLVQDPILIEWDRAGRLWVVELPGYMRDITADGELDPVGRIVVLEDVDNDGTMDTRTVFADKLVQPRALAVTEHGVLVGESPDIWLLRDTDGDLRSDTKERVTSGYGRREANVEINANSLYWAIDNRLYSAGLAADMFLRLEDGTFRVHPSVSRGQWGTSQDDAGRMYRNHNESPLHADLVPTPYYARNPHLLRTRGSHEPLRSPDGDVTAVWPSHQTPGTNRAYQHGILREDGTLARYTAACAPTIFRGDRLPADFSGNAFVAEPAANVVSRFILSDDGTTLRARKAYGRTEFLTSTDERFRPVHLSSAPDGTLYIADMYRGIIQHGAYITEYLREQILERQLEQPTAYGRIYRVVHDSVPRDRERMPTPAPPEALVAMLAHPNGWWRQTAQRLMVERGDTSVAPALAALAGEAPDWRTRVHALWTLDGLGAIAPAVVVRALDDESRDVRVSALRIAERWLGNPAHPIQAAVATRLEDADWAVRQQYAASIGALPDGLRADAAAALLERHGGDPITTDAALSGLAGVETAVLERLLARSGSRATPALEGAFTMLAATIVRSAQDAPVQRLFAWTADARAPWPRAALLRGAEIALLGAEVPGTAAEERRAAQAPGVPCPTCPGGRGGPGGAYAFPKAQAAAAAAQRTGGGRAGAAAMALEREPAALSRLAAQGGDAGQRAAKLLARLTWPGKAGAGPGAAPLTAADQQRFEAGRDVYRNICQGCHGPDGRGMDRIGPPLVGSALASAPAGLAARVILNGKEGEVGLMPPLGGTLSDEQIAGVLTYVRREWGGTGTPVDAATVARVRKATAGRARPWTRDELLALPAGSASGR
jgi:putative membrane-bound dehydrogenase-like protein